MNKAIIYKTTFPIPKEFKYNVHIVSNGYYYGTGRFCKTYKEAIEFSKLYNVIEIRKGY